MKYRSLEVLRGVAALSVVFAHSSTLLVEIHGLGFASFHHGLVFYGIPGLEFFFVLSGFVMAMVHGGDFGRLDRVPALLWSRFCRIYPLLWVVLLFRLWQVWDALYVTTSNIIDWFTLNPLHSVDTIPVVWTLKLELGFYALFAASLLPWVGPAILAVWLGVVMLHASDSPFEAMIPASVLSQQFVSNLLIFSVDFFVGMVAGLMFRRVRLPGAVSAALAAGGAALVLWRLPQDGWGLTFGPTAARFTYSAGHAAVLLGLASLERSGRLRIGRWAALLGVVSYPLYIVHVPVIDAVSATIIAVGRPHWMGQNAVFTLLVLTAFAASLALAYAVDRPLGRALRRLGPRPGMAALVSKPLQRA